MRYILVLLLLTGCWAPRCPVKTCEVNMEHRHADPAGAYAGRPIMSKVRFHNFLSKKEREKRRDTPSEGGRKRGRKPRTAKKLFDWEKD